MGDMPSRPWRFRTAQAAPPESNSVQPSRHPGRKVGGPEEPRRRGQELGRAGALPHVVARRYDLDTDREEPVGLFFPDAEAALGVLAVRDHDIGARRPDEGTQPREERLESRLPDYIPYHESLY
jgi:hypothetical protein